MNWNWINVTSMYLAKEKCNAVSRCKRTYKQH